MKRWIHLALLVFTCQSSFATEWASIYVYKQQEYLQGAWIRTTLFDTKNSYQYLHPVLFEDLLGSDNDQLAHAIFRHLVDGSPKRYHFNGKLTLSGDTVILSTKDSIPEFDAVRNETTASFVLNGFKAVRIIHAKGTGTFALQDISVPLMDLVLPGEKKPLPDSTTSPAPAPVPEMPSTTQRPNYQLIISMVVNALLLILLVRKRN